MIARWLATGFMASSDTGWGLRSGGGSRFGLGGGLIGFAQADLVDLRGAQTRQRLGALPQPRRHLERSKLAREEFGELLVGQAGAFAHDIDRADNLAEALVGNAEYARLGNVGMRIDRRFHLDTADILAAAMMMSFLRSTMNR